MAAVALTTYYFWGVDSSGGVSAVNDKLSLVYDGAVVVGGMVGDDQNRVVLAEVFEWSVGHVKRVVSAVAYRGKVRIVVKDICALFAEKLDDGERWRLAEIIDVALIGEPENENLGTVDRFAVAVETLGELIDNEVGHVDVDFAG